jgi:glycosyltransferase involved in cell wall biosynthesis
VLLIHNKLTRFVRTDRDLLRARYELEELAIAGHWASPWRVWEAVRRCDVLFCWFASMHSLLPALTGRVLGRPVVVVVGGYDTANMPEIDYGHQRGGLKKYVARAAMTLATRLIANSCYAAVEAVREAGMPAEKITVVYHGIALPMNGHRDGRGVARQMDLVLTVGNVDRPNLRRKGLEPFVQTAALLPHLRFVLVGEWLDRAIDDLRAIAPPNVTFPGRLCDAELHDLFGRAAVYVQASAHEGFGMALAEAMAAGCAPVVTRAGALPEVVGDAGVYAASADPAALATAIEHALTAGAALGEAARARTTKSFTLDRRARGLAAVLEAGGRT